MVSARQLNETVLYTYCNETTTIDSIHRLLNQVSTKKRARSLQSKRKKSVQKDHPSFQPIERDQEEGWRHLLVEVKMAIRTIARLARAGRCRGRYICISQYTAQQQYSYVFFEGKISIVQPAAAEQANIKVVSLSASFVRVDVRVSGK